MNSKNLPTPGGKRQGGKESGSPSPQPVGDCVAMANNGGEAVRFQSFRMRVFYIMENHRLYKIQRFHVLVTLEPERLKVTALNLFHPTASPLSKKCFFFILRHTLSRERGL